MRRGHGGVEPLSERLCVRRVAPLEKFFRDGGWSRGPTFFFVVLIIFLILTAISEFGLRKVQNKYSAGVRRA